MNPTCKATSRNEMAKAISSIETGRVPTTEYACIVNVVNHTIYSFSLSLSNRTDRNESRGHTDWLRIGSQPQRDERLSINNSCLI